MRVMIVDDHPLFRDGLKNLLAGRGIDVIGMARDGLEALEIARTLQPEVILMDLHMPHLDGLAATRLIKAELPEVVIVVLTMSTDDEDLFEAIKSGAAGYLLKSQDTEECLALLAGLARGEAPLSPGLAGRLLKEFGRQADELRALKSTAKRKDANILSSREIEVLRLVAEGLIYKEIGARLGITERAVKYHMGEIVDRLHVETRAQVLEYARQMGLTDSRQYPHPR